MGSKLLYAWYGDDFTGSTDVLEALALHGVRAVLFTCAPKEGDLKAFAQCQAIGIAGESRSQSPAWMTRRLPATFTSLHRLGATISHYKVCSTFDSSPQIGSIGRAIEIGRKVYGGGVVPIVVGAPHLGRSVAFGNLFASENGAIYRIDRHPTMQQHPVTPMKEADLRLHLARQTKMRIGSVDLSAFQRSATEAQLRLEEESGAEAVVFDGVDDATLDETARLLWKRARRRSMLVVGSSGMTYGLVHLWRRLGIAPLNPPQQKFEREQTLVLSGSCSPVTARQIRRAKQQGFAAWQVGREPEWDRVRNGANQALASGKSVLLFTALGPQENNEGYGRLFSAALGRHLREIVRESGVRRVLIVGGDTSTHVMQQLEIRALTFVASLAPGVPLCLAHAPDSELEGLEIALKGGQIGPEDLFARVRDGRAS